MTTDRSILILNRLRAMLRPHGMLTATPEEFAKKANVPVAEWRECVTRLRANKRVACNLERPDRRGRVTIWLQRRLPELPRDLLIAENPSYRATGKTLKQQHQDTRELGEVLGNALKPPKSEPDTEFLSGVEAGSVAYALMQISLVAASLVPSESKADVMDEPEGEKRCSLAGAPCATSPVFETRFPTSRPDGGRVFATRRNSLTT